MNPLERRMTKLEQANGDPDKRLAVIVRRIVGGPIVRASSGDQTIERASDEAEDAFIERAKIEALASTDRRPCRVIFLPKEALQ